MIKNKIGLIVLFAISIIIYSCKPETPPNNVDDRGHEMPYTTIYSFIQGKLSHDSAIGKDNKLRNYLGDGFVAAGIEKQEVKFEYNDNNELVSYGSVVLMPDVWYKLDIKFINKAGKEINYQFVENEEARKLHQFFFRTFLWEDDREDLNKMIKNQLIGSENIFEYRYGDKYSDGSFLDPPVGFVGYIKINGEKVKEKKINKVVLNGILVHSMSVNRLHYDRNEHAFVPYPFDSPGQDILGVTDIDHRFKVEIKK